MCSCELVVAILGLTVSGSNSAAQHSVIAFVCIYLGAFAASWVSLSIFLHPFQSFYRSIFSWSMDLLSYHLLTFFFWFSILIRVLLLGEISVWWKFQRGTLFWHHLNFHYIGSWQVRSTLWQSVQRQCHSPQLQTGLCQFQISTFKFTSLSITQRRNKTKWIKEKWTNTLFVLPLFHMILMVQHLHFWQKLCYRLLYTLPGWFRSWKSWSWFKCLLHLGRPLRTLFCLYFLFVRMLAFHSSFLIPRHTYATW